MYNTLTARLTLTTLTTASLNAFHLMFFFFLVFLSLEWLSSAMFSILIIHCRPVDNFIDSNEMEKSEIKKIGNVECEPAQQST